MNKELKEHIDAMDDDEKYTYRASLSFLEKLVDIIGISIIRNCRWRHERGPCIHRGEVRASVINS